MHSGPANSNSRQHLQSLFITQTGLSAELFNNNKLLHLHEVMPSPVNANLWETITIAISVPNSMKHLAFALNNYLILLSTITSREINFPIPFQSQELRYNEVFTIHLKFNPTKQKLAKLKKFLEPLIALMDDINSISLNRDNPSLKNAQHFITTIFDIIKQYIPVADDRLSASYKTLSISLSQIAQHTLTDNQPIIAIEYYLQSTYILALLPAQARWTYDVKSMLSQTYLSLAHAYYLLSQQATLPEDLDRYNRLALLSLKLGDAEESNVPAVKVLLLDTYQSCIRSFNVLAEVDMQRGNFDSAYLMIKKALEICNYLTRQLVNDNAFIRTKFSLNSNLSLCLSSEMIKLSSLELYKPKPFEFDEYQPSPAVMKAFDMFHQVDIYYDIKIRQITAAITANIEEIIKDQTFIELNAHSSAFIAKQQIEARRDTLHQQFAETTSPEEEQKINAQLDLLAPEIDKADIKFRMSMVDDIFLNTIIPLWLCEEAIKNTTIAPLMTALALIELNSSWLAQYLDDPQPQRFIAIKNHIIDDFIDSFADTWVAEEILTARHLPTELILADNCKQNGINFDLIHPRLTHFFASINDAQIAITPHPLSAFEYACKLVKFHPNVYYPLLVEPEKLTHYQKLQNDSNDLTFLIDSTPSSEKEEVAGIQEQLTNLTVQLNILEQVLNAQTTSQLLKSMCLIWLCKQKPNTNPNIEFNAQLCQLLVSEIKDINLEIAYKIGLVSSFLPITTAVNVTTPLTDEMAQQKLTSARVELEKLIKIIFTHQQLSLANIEVREDSDNTLALLQQLPISAAKLETAVGLSTACKLIDMLLLINSTKALFIENFSYDTSSVNLYSLYGIKEAAMQYLLPLVFGQEQKMLIDDFVEKLVAADKEAELIKAEKSNHIEEKHSEQPLQDLMSKDVHTLMAQKQKLVELQKNSPLIKPSPLSTIAPKASRKTSPAAYPPTTFSPNIHTRHLNAKPTKSPRSAPLSKREFKK